MLTKEQRKAWPVLSATLDDLVPLIRQRRTDRKLSLRAAAEEIGIPYSTLDHIERGVSPKLSTVRLIIDWLAT